MDGRSVRQRRPVGGGRPDAGPLVRRGRPRLRRARHVSAAASRESTQWPCRPDPFSTYRAGFELHTY
ncbi:SpvB/TcaC N-terminal domain-containing protein [Kitasatospora sp. NPDC053057]|uniref:SpvB/TcaC N-terminal domain-containing protein n=1 Tax=Kitasatospora sp. NPDC053057 TaxID=3364062 RepID=UPI0037C9C6F8